MACQMVVVAKFRVAVSREHLSMCVHVDAGALRLIQNILQVVHVVATDQRDIPIE